MKQNLLLDTADENSVVEVSNRERIARNSFQKAVKTAKQLIWAYFILLIFEGALRKWVFPDLASPLLIIRDPIAIWLLIFAWRHRLFYFNRYIIAMFVIGGFSFITAMLFGHHNLIVAVYGIRTLILHFPIIFIIGAVFDREDVIKMARFIVYLVLPMTVLVIFQFYSPQSSWVNRGVGGDTAGGGFSGALGFFRPPATFSFTNGTTLFYSLSACFIFFFWVAPQIYIKRPLLIAATVALCMSVPLSISRTLFFSVIVTLAFLTLAVAKSRGNTVRIILAGVIIVIALAALSQLTVFQTATAAFTARFSGASEAEGGLKGTLGDRYLGGMIGAITNSGQLPFFGQGIGLGTNVGSQLVTGKSQFLVAEGEWPRLIGEMGIIMGISVIIIRLLISAKIAIASYNQVSQGNSLPWILSSFCLLTLPQAQWAQPTALGFSIFAAGLTIASMRYFVNNGKESDQSP